jgi:hypothetical protein
MRWIVAVAAIALLCFAHRDRAQDQIEIYTPLAAACGSVM